ncbi:hypothetical protein ARMSODRAFT_1028390 [Armillaria solidipes]|uniref:Endonuclease/exonuclease/phosphatase domain-containing protein n=1 Tax=Armillaria solidipes TaxID=1076256 RepID=A0A2H3AKJ5_9AGAR|nr:hypothetical protein ARMSODRAFT_1028390 [Armillaria solidipes]
MNIKGVPTFFSRSSNGAESVIDLTFANATAIAGNLLVDWRVDPGSSYTSDHSAIFWRIDQDVKVVENALGEQYNLKDADAGEWEEDFKIKIEGFYDSMREIEQATSESMDQSQLDEIIAQFHMLIQESIESVVPKRKLSKHAYARWGREMKNAC